MYADAAARFPDKEKILDNVESIAIAALTSTANCPASGEQGKLFKQEVGFLVSIATSEDWKEFTSALCEELIGLVITKKTLLPSALMSCLMQKVDSLLSDASLIDNLLEKLDIPLIFNDDSQSQFFLEFILSFAREILSFISKTFRAGARRTTKPPPVLDKDDRQVVYYIGGSIMRGYMRIAYRYKASKSWQEVVKVLKARVLQEKPNADQIEDANWTMAVDRGGLLYITPECQNFFLPLTTTVFSCEKSDGSIDYEQVTEKVSHSDICILWDDMISQSLSERNSLNLMNDVVRCFSRTCARGFARRRLNFLKQKPVVSMPTRHAVARRKKN